MTKSGRAWNPIENALGDYAPPPRRVSRLRPACCYVTVICCQQKSKEYGQIFAHTSLLLWTSAPMPVQKSHFRIYNRVICM